MKTHLMNWYSSPKKIKHKRHDALQYDNEEEKPMSVLSEIGE